MADESLEIDPDSGGVSNVIVFLARVPEGVPIPAPGQDPVSLTGIGFRFEPHILVFQAGKTVEFKNEDSIPHQFNTNLLRNDAINHLVNPGETLTRRVERPERAPTAVQSNLFPFMRGYFLPLAHPWFAVTDARGRFEIHDLPAGKHEFTIWHEATGFLERQFAVEIVAGETASLNRIVAVEALGEKPPARQGDDLPPASIGPFDLAAPGNGDDVRIARAILKRALTRKLAAIDRACALTETQKRKLLLAATGDTEKLLEQAQKLRAEFLQLANEPRQIAAFLGEKIGPLRARWKAGIFESDSLFGKTLLKTLTPEQRTQLGQDPVH